MLVRESLGHILRRAQGVCEALEQDAGVWLPYELCQHLGISPAAAAGDERVLRALLALLFGPRILSEQTMLRRQVRAELKDPQQVELFEALVAADLAIIDVGPDDSESLVPFSMGVTAGLNVGWRLRFAGEAIVLSAQAMVVDGPEKQRQTAEGLLGAVVDPWGSYSRNDVGAVVPEEIDRWRRRVAARLDDDVEPARLSPLSARLVPKRDAREMVARTRSPEDLAPLLVAIPALRFVLTGPFLAIKLGVRVAHHPRLEETLPVVAILEELGVALDGSMAAVDVESLRREPLAMLRVPPDHPACRGLDLTEPLSSALDWATRHADAPASTGVRQAWETLLTERRWAATLPTAEDVSDERWLRVLPYPRLIGALMRLFDGDALDVALRDVGLPEGSEWRIARALGLPSDEPLTAGDLPAPPRRLDTLLGIGPKTYMDLHTALRQLAKEWRAVAAGLAPGPNPSSAADLGDGQAGGLDAGSADGLADGLAELAALFGDG